MVLVAFKNSADDAQARARRAVGNHTGDHEISLREEWASIRDHITRLELERKKHHKFSTQGRLLGKEIADYQLRVREIKGKLGIGPTNEVKTFAKFFLDHAQEVLPAETFEKISTEARTRMIAEARERRHDRED